LASIDAFWELAANRPAPKPALRISLLRLDPAATSTVDRQSAQQRVLILFGVVLVHVLLVLALRAAMHQRPFANREVSTPLQITFIERHAALAVPKPTVAPPHSHASAALQPFIPRKDALQAVTILPQAVSVEPTPQRALLYDTDGTLRVPQAPMQSHPRDLLAHRSVAFMLPGAGHKNSPDFHVRSIAPRDIVNQTGGMFSGMIANANAVMAIGQGMAPDRGLRTSNRDSDPCQDIEQDMAYLNDSKVREQAEERYERSCEGH
jgi:hypothetical protein